MPGTTVCSNHGAMAPQVRQAAATRLLTAQVNGDLQKRGWEPVTDPLVKYADLGGEVLTFKDLARERIAFLSSWETDANALIAEDTRAAVQVYERALDRADKILTSMLRLGLDAEALRQGRERPTREQASTLVSVLSAVMADPRVTCTDSQSVILDALKALDGSK